MRLILAAVLLSVTAVAASAQSSVQVSATVLAAPSPEPTLQGSGTPGSQHVTPLAESVAASVARSSILSSYRTDYGAGSALPTAGQIDAGPLEVVQTANGSHFRKVAMPAGSSVRIDATSRSGAPAPTAAGANTNATPDAPANANGMKERAVTVTFTVAANS